MFYFTQLNMAVQKSKALHRQPNTVKVDTNGVVIENVDKPQYISFTDFVKKRKILEIKALGRRRSRSIEKEMYDKDNMSYKNGEENDEKDEYPIKI